MRFGESRTASLLMEKVTMSLPDFEAGAKKLLADYVSPSSRHRPEPVQLSRKALPTGMLSGSDLGAA